MQVDNVATGQYPGLQALGITPTALAAIAPLYLVRDPAETGLLGIRHRPR
jgi:NADH dehydrogenase